MQPSSALQPSHGNSNPDWHICSKEKAEVFSLLFFAATQSFLPFSLRRVLGGALPYRFPNATQSFGLFSLRRVLGGCVSVWFRAATQSSVPFSLRRVLFPSCCFLSRPRRRVSCRFLCVVSWWSTLLCGFVPRRRVL